MKAWVLLYLITENNNKDRQSKGKNRNGAVPCIRTNFSERSHKHIKQCFYPEPNRNTLPFGKHLQTFQQAGLANSPQL